MNKISRQYRQIQILISIGNIHFIDWWYEGNSKGNSWCRGEQ